MKEKLGLCRIVLFFVKILVKYMKKENTYIEILAVSTFNVRFVIGISAPVAFKHAHLQRTKDKVRIK